MSQQTMMWVVMDCDSTPERYVIEAMDNQGVVYKTTFEGPDAERRACEYAQWKDEEACRNIAAGMQPGNYHPLCQVTGNLVGTDTRPLGDPCRCPSCAADAGDHRP